MPKLDVDAVSRQRGSSYPPPHNKIAAGRIRQRLGEAGGLEDFGANLLQLPPGSGSSQRHWHSEEDEFVWVVSGEVTLVENDGETLLRAGDCAAFPKGARNGHQLINRSSQTALCLEIGSRSETDFCIYPDIDMSLDSRDGIYRHTDGTAYSD